MMGSVKSHGGECWVYGGVLGYMVEIVGLHCGELSYMIGMLGNMVGSVELHGGECWITWCSIGLHGGDCCVALWGVLG